jgi:hypothetical protein
VVSSKVLNSKGGNLVITDLTSYSDEAFVLLLIDNSEELWKFKSREQQGLVMPGDMCPPPKYTSTASKTKPSRIACSTRRNGGWCVDEIWRFNDYLANVRIDKKENGQWFSKILCEHLGQHMLTDHPVISNDSEPEVVLTVKADNDLQSDDDDVGENDGNTC